MASKLSRLRSPPPWGETRLGGRRGTGDQRPACLIRSVRIQESLPQRRREFDSCFSGQPRIHPGNFDDNQTGLDGKTQHRSRAGFAPGVIKGHDELTECHLLRGLSRIDDTPIRIRKATFSFHVRHSITFHARWEWGVHPGDLRRCRVSPHSARPGRGLFCVVKPLQ